MKPHHVEQRFSVLCTSNIIIESNDVRTVAIHLQVALRSDTSWDWAGWGLGLQSHVSDQLPVRKHKWFMQMECCQKGLGC